MLERIHIKNFRSCRDVEFSLGEGVCALIGKNGVGKTNILKAVDWLAGSVVRPEPMNVSRTQFTQVDQDIEVGLAFRLGNQRYEYSLSYPYTVPSKMRDSLGIRETLSVSDPATTPREILRRSGREVYLEERADPILLLGLMPSFGALGSLLPESDPFRLHLNPIINSLSAVHYYSVEGNSKNPDELGYVTRADYEDWLSRYLERGELTDSVVLRLILMNEEKPELFEHLMAYIGPDDLDLVESVTLFPHERPDPRHLDNGLETPQRSLYAPSFRPSRGMGGADRALMFHELSLGTRRMIRLITSLLFNNSSVMLVEQPEDSIHSGMLRKLIDIFRSISFSKQIILTTHSAEIIDILKPEEIRFVTAEQGGTEVRSLDLEELTRAKWYLDNEGALSQFLQTIDE